MTKEEILNAKTQHDFVKDYKNYNCINCINCKDCYYCINCYYSENQINKNYMVHNIQLTREEYMNWKKLPK